MKLCELKSGKNLQTKNMNTLHVNISVEKEDRHVTRCNMSARSSNTEEHNAMQVNMRKKLIGITQGCQFALANVIFAMQKNGGDVEAFLQEFVEEVKRSAEAAYMQFTITGREPDVNLN